MTATATDEQQYEHRVPKKFPTLVQVRPVMPRGHTANWSAYMHCRSHADALRILWLLSTSSVTDWTP